MSSTSTAHNSPAASLFYSPPITIVLTVILLICFFIFFSMYFCRCVLKNFLSTMDIRSPGTMLANSGALVSPGLDPALIQSFPTFVYSTVKDFRKERYGIECSICLNEFNDEDFLRLLTACYHVFHQECIDLWLGSHKTCPVCRRDLDLHKPLEKSSPILVHSTSMIELEERINDVNQDFVSIDIKESREECGASATKDVSLDEQKVTREKRDRSLRPHSTGHSILSNVDEDRYTLRLIENVKLKITKGHNSTASCIAFGEFSSPITTRKGGDGAEFSEENIDRV